MYRVFGDIEDKDSVFNIMMSNLRNTEPPRRIIYLGDFYSPWSSSKCIDQIQTILEYHGIEPLTPFTDSNLHDIQHLQYMWQDLFDRKRLNVYKEGHIQFFQTSPLSYPTDSGAIFKGKDRNMFNGRPKSNIDAYGKSTTDSFVRASAEPFIKARMTQPPAPKLNTTNKFSILANDTSDSPPSTPKKTHRRQQKPGPHGRTPQRSTPIPKPDKSIDYNQSLGSRNKADDPIFLFGNKDVGFIMQLLQPIKLTVTDDHKLITTYHSFRKYDNGAIRVNSYTASELNTMFTLLSHCRHYYVDHNICYIHCYRNARYLDCLPFNKIVCGHNKAFGMFKDDEIKGKFIFMLDYTIIDDDNQLPPQVYFDVNKSRVIMNDDRFFPPAMLESCHMISISDNMLTTPIGDWIDPANDIEVHHAQSSLGAIISVPVVNQLRHLNKYTQRHDCYSDTELVDDEAVDHIKHREA